MNERDLQGISFVQEGLRCLPAFTSFDILTKGNGSSQDDRLTRIALLDQGMSDVGFRVVDVG